MPASAVANWSKDPRDKKQRKALKVPARKGKTKLTGFGRETQIALKAEKAAERQVKERHMLENKRRVTARLKRQKRAAWNSLEQRPGLRAQLRNYLTAGIPVDREYVIPNHLPGFTFNQLYNARKHQSTTEHKKTGFEALDLKKLLVRIRKSGEIHEEDFSDFITDAGSGRVNRATLQKRIDMLSVINDKFCVLKARQMAGISRMLLALCGDVESNPGPPKKAYTKNAYARKKNVYFNLNAAHCCKDPFSPEENGAAPMLHTKIHTSEEKAKEKEVEDCAPPAADPPPPVAVQPPSPPPGPQVPPPAAKGPRRTLGGDIPPRDIFEEAIRDYHGDPTSLMFYSGVVDGKGCGHALNENVNKIDALYQQIDIEFIGYKRSFTSKWYFPVYSFLETILQGQVSYYQPFSLFFSIAFFCWAMPFLSIWSSGWTFSFLLWFVHMFNKHHFYLLSKLKLIARGQVTQRHLYFIPHIYSCVRAELNTHTDREDAIRAIPNIVKRLANIELREDATEEREFTEHVCACSYGKGPLFHDAGSGTWTPDASLENSASRRCESDSDRSYYRPSELREVSEAQRCPYHGLGHHEGKSCTCLRIGRIAHQISEACQDLPSPDIHRADRKSVV